MDNQLNRSVIIAAFDDRLAARQAVSELEAVGFGHSDIGFVIRGDDAVEGGMITDASGTRDGTGAIRGAIGVTLQPHGRADLFVEALKRHGGYDIATAAVDPLDAAEGAASRAHETLI